MSNDKSKSDVDQDLLVSHEVFSQVEDIGGVLGVRFSVPSEMQGHTFAMDLTPASSPTTPVGPFRLEYALGTEFMIYEERAPKDSLESGYSHLVMTPKLKDLKINFTYSDTKLPDVVKQGDLTFIETDNVVQRLVIETDEPDISTAIKHTNQIVADLLDAIAFVKGVPISVRHIDVQAIGSKFCRRYITFPYAKYELSESDITEAQNIPQPLRSALRLYREGLNSSRPPYRLLCLYRVREVVEKIRIENSRGVAARGVTVARAVRVLPDNKLTQCYFSEFVGKKVGAFLDHVREKYRIPVAHGNLDDYFKLVLDPSDVRIDHRIDFTNAALAPIVAEMIRDEVAFMNQSKS